MELKYLHVPVADLAATVAFYADVLGLEEAWREGEDTVAFWVPDRSVQLMLVEGGHATGPMYLVDDAAAWAAAHADVPVRVPRYDIPGGSVAGYGDPGGNVFYVYDQRHRAQPAS